MLSRLFIAALWSPAGKGLTSWLSFVMFNCFVTFPCGVLGQVWYLIVSILDLCRLSYFEAGKVQSDFENQCCLFFFLLTKSSLKTRSTYGHHFNILCKAHIASQKVIGMDESRGGTGGPDPPPLKNQTSIGFPGNIYPDPLKITKLPSQYSMVDHYRHASETPFQWQPTMTHS